VLLKFVCTYNFEFEAKGDLGEMLNNPIKLHIVDNYMILMQSWPNVSEVFVFLKI
jgi:hypothetical protein